MSTLDMMCHAVEQKIKNWLLEEVEVRAPYEPVRKEPRRRRISFLLAANGGWNVTNWGFITTYNDSAHRRGLEDVREGLELMSYFAFFNGIDFAGFDAKASFYLYFDEYLKEHNLEKYFTPS